MTKPSTGVPAQPLLLKRMRPHDVARHLERDPRLIVPVGTTEQHGPHVPLGCDTLIVERLADDLSAEFQVLRAPTVEYGVNAPTEGHPAGNAAVRRKTLHRFLNDLIGSWERSGVEHFVILTAHGHDPHQEALSTLRTTAATIRVVDILAVPLPASAGAGLPIHGGEVDTSLLLYVDPSLVDLALAEDYYPTRRDLRRFRRAQAGRLPSAGPGSLGEPSRASVEQGDRLYHLIYDRVATRMFRAPLSAAP